MLYDRDPALDLSKYETIISPIVEGVFASERGLVGKAEVRTLTREIVLRVLKNEKVASASGGKDERRIAKTIEGIVRRQLGIPRGSHGRSGAYVDLATPKGKSLSDAAVEWAKELFESGEAPSSKDYWIEEDIAGLEAIEESVGRQLFETDRKFADKTIKKYLKSVE